MDSSFSIWLDTINPEIVLCTYLGVSGYNCLKIFYTLTKGVDPDEMPHYVCKSIHLEIFRTQRVKGSTS